MAEITLRYKPEKFRITETSQSMFANMRRAVAEDCLKIPLKDVDLFVAAYGANDFSGRDLTLTVRSSGYPRSKKMTSETIAKHIHKELQTIFSHKKEFNWSFDENMDWCVRVELTDNGYAG